MKLCPIVAFLALAACAPKAQKPSSEQLALGERAYQKCYSCHALGPSRNDLSAPTLHGIVGRPVAAETGFDYSPAMRRFAAHESRWTEQLLGRFVSDPQAVVPGTSMAFHGTTDPREREALIAYLKHHTSASAASLP